MKNILFGSVVAAALIFSGCGSSSSSSSTPAAGNDNNGSNNQGGGNDNNGSNNQGGGNDNNGSNNQGGGNDNNGSTTEADLNITVREVTINTRIYLDRNDINMTDVYGTTRSYAFAKDYCEKLDGNKWALPTLADLNETLVTGITVNNDGDEGSFTSLSAGVFPNNINTSFIWVGSSDATNPIILNLSDKSKQDKTNIGTNNDVTSKGLFTCIKK